MPPKKGGKKNKDDDWDDGALEKKMAAVKMMEVQEKEDAAWDDVSDDEPAPPPPPKANRAKAAFAMLMEDDDNSAQSESEPEAEPSPVKKPEPKKEKAEPKKEKPEPKNEKKKGKKGKKGKEEDDELDAILADLEKPIEKEPAGKGKKKGAKADQAPKEEAADGTPEPSPPAQAEGAEGETVAEEEGKKKKKKKKDKKKEASEEGDEPKETAEATAEGDEEKADEKTDDKKKKKKKKDKEKKTDEDDKPKKKKHVDMIKEFLRAKKEAEEAEAQRIQEEQDRLEQLEKEREEQERLAKEKRDAEKERKRLAILKQKEEGVYKTAKEKEKAKIAAMKFAAAGIDITAIGSAGPPSKPIVYMDKRALKKQKLREAKAAAEEAKSEESKEMSKDDKSQDSQPTEEPLDDWELADVEEIKVVTTDSPPPPKASAVSTDKKVAKEPSVEEEESSEEESDDDDSNDDESGSSEEESSSEDEGPRGKETKEQIKERVKARLKKRSEAAEAKRNVKDLRAPVICVLGHVDTGKTKMLDTIRRTHVQEGEAGGITQQIGATRVPDEAIKERCKLVSDFSAEGMILPGFLIIDTPGHESFSNLRSRGSSLCDFAILVVDLMHGLEAQTLESLKMLLKRNTPFVVALNKIDRLYGYESNPRKDVYQHLKSQSHNTQMEFRDKCNLVIGQFAEQGLNVCLGNENLKDPDYIKMVPTSAMKGDGIGNLMAFIVNKCQTEHAAKLAFSEELDASVMEVKVIAGLGTTIDVILVNGYLNVGDVLVLTGLDGAIMTPVRELLMPQALKELRVKNEYERHKQVKGAQGVKLLAKGLEKTVAGLPIYVAHNEDEVDLLKEKAEQQLSKALTSIKKKPEGVYVMASTLGSLEALLEFLRTQKIPYSNVNIGPVHRKDVQRAAAMKEHNSEYACILAFDVKVERDAQIFADHEGVKIFQADIIYHLEDSFLKYREDLRLEARRQNEHKAIYPCKLKILPQHIFNARNPIVCGVNVEAGLLKRGTPICVPSKDKIFIGTVSSIQRNHEEVATAKKGDEICIKIDNTTGEAPKLYGRHFNHEDILVSMITRDSIDVCKTYFRDDLAREDWQLVVELKKVLDIM